MAPRRRVHRIGGERADEAVIARGHQIGRDQFLAGHLGSGDLLTLLQQEEDGHEAVGAHVAIVA